MIPSAMAEWMLSTQGPYPCLALTLQNGCTPNSHQCSYLIGHIIHRILLPLLPFSWARALPFPQGDLGISLHYRYRLPFSSHPSPTGCGCFVLLWVRRTHVASPTFSEGTLEDARCKEQ